MSWTTQAPSSSTWCRWPPKHRPRAIPEPITLSSSPSPRRHPRDSDTIVPALSLDPQHHRPPWVIHDIIDPTTSLSPRCRRPCAIPKPTTSSSSPSPRYLPACNTTLYIFLYHFRYRNTEFDMLHYHIALICYKLLHYFCSTTLLWYVTLPHCYITFVLLHYSKYSYIATLLWYATYCSLDCGYVSCHSRLKSL
jgi:hypothetical protein